MADPAVANLSQQYLQWSNGGDVSMNVQSHTNEGGGVLNQTLGNSKDWMFTINCN